MAQLSTVGTKRVPVTTTYHGVEVTEDYRWLEDAASEETRAWTEAQHERTVAYLRSSPSYEDIRRRAEEILKVESTSYADLRRGGATTFALKTQPPKQQPFIVTLTDLGDLATERILVDPNAIDPTGATTIDWYEPSPDGRSVAVSLSEHGTEDDALTSWPDRRRPRRRADPSREQRHRRRVDGVARRLGRLLVHAPPRARRGRREHGVLRGRLVPPDRRHDGGPTGPRRRVRR
jgi:hypothetical protein